MFQEAPLFLLQDFGTALDALAARKASLGCVFLRGFHNLPYRLRSAEFWFRKQQEGKNRVREGLLDDVL